MRLEIPAWTSHHNMIIYSLFYYSEENAQEVDIVFNADISINGAILYFRNKRFFLDYSDDLAYIDKPDLYDYYFKRSLPIEAGFENVYPLDFQVNFSYKSLGLLKLLNWADLLKKRNRVELVRAMDYCNIITNLSHNAMDLRFFPNEIADNNGSILYMTRLWNPDNHPDLVEKKRRVLQNEFRIAACRIIKKNFKNGTVGLFPDPFSSKAAPDLLLDIRDTSKKNYLKSLRQADICIADDGLKDTPGWKIGEYTLFGKAVVSTPISIVVSNFKEHINYEKVSDRNSVIDLSDKIESLLHEKRYLKMGQNNLNWSNAYLHPKNYIRKIISVLDIETKNDS